MSIRGCLLQSTYRSSLFASIGLAALVSSPSAAQTGPSAATPANPAEILVTAQRRAERVLDVPLAVSAISNEELDSRNVQRLSDLQTAIPGLWIVETQPGSERLQLRGVSQQTGLPTVAQYIDEVNVTIGSVASGISIRAIDLERIEVLRGPQATLYGEGSMGGTVRYISAAPDLEKAVVRGNAQVGGINSGGTAWLTEGAASIPLVEGKLAVRVAGAYEDTGGYIDTPRGKNVNGARYTTLRGKVLFKPSNQFDATITYLHQDAKQDDASYGDDKGRYFYADGVAQPSSNRYNFVNGVLNLHLDGATITSSTGYLKVRTLLDNFFPFAFPLPNGALLPLSSSTRSVGTARRWTQELRIVSESSSPLTYLLGVNYTNDRNFSGFGVLPITTPVVLDQLTTSRVWSVYGEVGYKLANGLSALVGGRYFEDRRSNVGDTVRRKFTTFNPRFNISYNTGSGTIYANASKGFRSGGFNTPGLFRPGEETFAPERLWSYEVGAKQEFLDRRLIVDASVYYNDYKGIQSLLLPTNNQPQQGRTINSGIARGFGAELAVTARPTDGLTASLTAGYNDVKYKTQSLAVNPGDPLDNTPRWTVSTSLDYRQPISERATVFGRVDVGYNSDFVSTLRLLSSLSIVQRNGSPFPVQVRTLDRTVVNARAGVTLDSIELYVYGQNLTNNFNAVYAGGVVQAAEGIRPRPRTLGAGASFKF